MSTLNYGFQRTMRDDSFGAAMAKVTSALKQEGFGILTEIDVRATFRKKLDREFRPYIILGACNPQLAFKALSAEPHIGLLLPCNVVIQQTDAGTEVSIADPETMFSLVPTPGLRPVVDEARERLQRVAQALS